MYCTRAVRLERGGEDRHGGTTGRIPAPRVWGRRPVQNIRSDCGRARRPIAVRGLDARVSECNAGRFNGQKGWRRRRAFTDIAPRSSHRMKLVLLHSLSLFLGHPHSTPRRLCIRAFMHIYVDIYVFVHALVHVFVFVCVLSSLSALPPSAALPSVTRHRTSSPLRLAHAPPSGMCTHALGVLSWRGARQS
ncbi:hypothetical protein DFH06DRAFT_170221 [Mycena polygramma]|nr:hypothetical protein DFH06DRAFT_170221 [Mycena polygramma]